MLEFLVCGLQDDLTNLILDMSNFCWLQFPPGGCSLQVSFCLNCSVKADVQSFWRTRSANNKEINSYCVVQLLQYCVTQPNSTQTIKEMSFSFQSTWVWSWTHVNCSYSSVCQKSIHFLSYLTWIFFSYFNLILIERTALPQASPTDVRKGSKYLCVVMVTGTSRGTLVPIQRRARALGLISQPANLLSFLIRLCAPIWLF